MRASAIATHRRDLQAMGAIGIALPNRDVVARFDTPSGRSS